MLALPSLSFSLYPRLPGSPCVCFRCPQTEAIFIYISEERPDFRSTSNISAISQEGGLRSGPSSLRRSLLPLSGWRLSGALPDLSSPSPLSVPFPALPWSPRPQPSAAVP